jgi:hypothetical protein
MHVKLSAQQTYKTCTLARAPLYMSSIPGTDRVRVTADGFTAVCISLTALGEALDSMDNARLSSSTITDRGSVKEDALGAATDGIVLHKKNDDGDHDQEDDGETIRAVLARIGADHVHIEPPLMPRFGCDPDPDDEWDPAPEHTPSA